MTLNCLDPNKIKKRQARINGYLGALAS
ncbi:hypothetical protein ACCS47_29055 [Rhizobium brockwellii]